MKACKDCGSTTRSLPYPGPRCTTCHRAVTKARKARASDLRREKVYGLTPEQFKALWEAQGEVCGACGKPIRRKPCVDHDHETREVRGILHPDCNRTLIGRFTAEQLIQAARYLLDPPAPRTIGKVLVP